MINNWNWTTVCLAAASLTAGLSIGSEAAAESLSPQIADVDGLSLSDHLPLAQVTSVSELSDVLPTDWAFSALQRLVEDYGCLEGYPDRSFRGNRAMTRYEFAAGLNACLDVITQLAGGAGDTDLATIRRLQDEFATELAVLRGRVDILEASTADLAASQFSTTTKLHAQLDSHLVIPLNSSDLGVTSRGGGGDEEPTFEYRARLNFDTSFTGADRLRIQLQASDRGNPRSVSAISGGLAHQSGPATTSTDTVIPDGVKLNQVYYSFPIGNRLDWTVAANGLFTDDLVSSTILPFNGPSVGRFGKKSVYEAIRSGSDNFTLGVNWSLTDNLILDAGYLAGDSQNSSVGLFDQYQYVVQLN